MYSSRTTHPFKPQRGAAFIVMLVILIMGVTAFLVSSLSSSAIQIKRDQVTAEALAQAKEALIGYAASVDLSSGTNRPGDLPCPDTNNDGIAELSCGNALGTTGQAQRIGRLPWKTLGLPDLRDSSGERLWYAVSNNFKNNTRTTCTSPGQPGCLNSDTAGTISVFSPDGTLINNGGGSTGAVAVIIAPGDVLTRQGGALQDRSIAGVNTATNYLDIATVGGNMMDNANFIEGSSTNGFIQGRIQDTNGNLIVNDQLLVITQDNIMQAVQKRIIAEVRLCLTEYASIPQNYGRYPWTTDPTNVSNYNDVSDQLFGRVPDQTFDNTKSDSGDNMKDVWGANCNIQYGSWWLNWKEMVFYGLADSYKPLDPPNTSAACGTCLTVNPPSAAANKKIVVIVAGKTMTGQIRVSNADKGNLSNYLEFPNSAGTSPFAQSAPSATFNDTVVFQ